MTSPALPDGIRWISTAEGLEDLAGLLRHQPEVVLDTEFHAERRYIPELMLLQIGLPEGEVAVVDARALDLRPLAPVLADRPWVVHGGRQDLVILHHLLGVLPAILRDTQLLAGVTGRHYPVGLGALCAELLGEQVDKAEGLTDWTRRPLGAEQLAYAAKDVRLAARTWEALAAQHPDRVPLAEELGAELIAEVRDPPAPEAGVSAWRMAEDLDDNGLRILAALYRWREEEARRRDQPPHYLLSEGICLDLARRQPLSVEALRRNRRTPSGLVKRHGQRLVRIVAEARRSQEAPPPTLSREQWRQLARDRIWAQAVQARTGIHAELILPRALASSLAREDARLDGWRAEWCGDFFSAWREGFLLIDSLGQMRIIDAERE